MAYPIECCIFLESVVSSMNSIFDTRIIEERTEALECEVRGAQSCQPQFGSTRINKMIAMILEKITGSYQLCY